MSAFPYMPLYVADYLADTTHLSALEHGVYMLLIMTYWRHGKLPEDDVALARIGKVSPREWARIKPTIAALFDGNWKHKRIEQELEKCSRKSDARSEAGARGGHAKALNSKQQAVANATILPQQKDDFALASSSESESKRVTNVTLKAREEDFEALRKAYPKRAGTDPRHPALKSFQNAVKRGGDPVAMIDGARKYAAFMAESDPQFIKQLSTWLNQQCWLDDYSRPAPRDGPNGQGRKADPYSQIFRELHGIGGENESDHHTEGYGGGADFFGAGNVRQIG